MKIDILNARVKSTISGSVNKKLPFVSSSTTQRAINKTREETHKVHWRGYYFSVEIIDKIMEYYKDDFNLLGYKSLAISLKQRQQIRKDMLDEQKN